MESVQLDMLKRLVLVFSMPSNKYHKSSMRDEGILHAFRLRHSTISHFCFASGTKLNEGCAGLAKAAGLICQLDDEP